MNFGEALNQLRLGARIYRVAWNGTWLTLEEDAAPSIYLRHRNGTKNPWTPLQADVLAEDWLIRVERDESTEPEGLAAWERELLAKQGSYSTPATPVTEVHVYLDGQKIYDAMQPHAQRYRRNNGGLV